MKIFISIDLEGITGVCKEEQTDPDGPEYSSACAAMRADLDAALDGCFSAEATDVVVCDGHAAGRNLRVTGLPDGVALVSWSPWSLDMMTGIDESFDAVLCLGYHARAGVAAAVLEHTCAYKVFSVTIGGVEVGEFALNAMLAGHFGVPCAFVSGDDKAVAEARDLVPGIGAAVVKTSLARTCTSALPPAVTAPLLREGVRAALTGQLPDALRWPGSALQVAFVRTHYCDAAAAQAGTQRLDGRTIEITGDSYLEVFKTFSACLQLAETAGPPSSE
jgi:D-amino peptidase